MDIQIKSDERLIELLVELQSKHNEGKADGCMTIKQICQRMGITEKAACKLVRELIELGKVEHVYVPHTSIDGRRIRGNGYRLKPG